MSDNTHQSFTGTLPESSASQNQQNSAMSINELCNSTSSVSVNDPLELSGARSEEYDDDIQFAARTLGNLRSTSFLFYFFFFLHSVHLLLLCHLLQALVSLSLGYTHCACACAPIHVVVTRNDLCHQPKPCTRP